MPPEDRKKKPGKQMQGSQVGSHLSQSTTYLSSIQSGAYIFDRTWHLKLKRVTDMSVKPTTDAKKAAKPVI